MRLTCRSDLVPTLQHRQMLMILRVRCVATAAHLQSLAWAISEAAWGRLTWPLAPIVAKQQCIDEPEGHPWWTGNPALLGQIPGYRCSKMARCLLNSPGTQFDVYPTRAQLQQLCALTRTHISPNSAHDSQATRIARHIRPVAALKLQLHVFLWLVALPKPAKADLRQVHACSALQDACVFSLHGPVMT